MVKITKKKSQFLRFFTTVQTQMSPPYKSSAARASGVAVAVAMAGRGGPASRPRGKSPGEGWRWAHGVSIKHSTPTLLLRCVARQGAALYLLYSPPIFARHGWNNSAAVIINAR